MNNQWPSISISRPAMDVTSIHRPDTSWHIIDQAGHEHRWYDTSGVAKDYSPLQSYHVPTIEWITVHEATDEYPEEGYYECIQCGEKIKPAYCPDQVNQYILGELQYYIDGKSATKEEVLEVIKIHYPEDYDPAMLD